MANKKITDLTELTVAASDDYLEIVDTSANASKKITRENLISSSGGWQSWTPTIGYVGGSGTPTISANGRYTIVGKIVYLLLTGWLTRNGATHAYLTFTLPTSVATFGSGSFTHQFGEDLLSIGAVYKSTGDAHFTVMTGTWQNEGLYWFSGFYEMP